MNVQWLKTDRTARITAQKRGLQCAAAVLLAVTLLATGCKPSAPPPTAAGASPSPQGKNAAPTGSSAVSKTTAPAASATQPKTQMSAVPRPKVADLSDPMYRLTPETLARITEAANKTPVRPLPGKADTSRSFTLWKTKAEFWRKAFLDGFRGLKYSDLAFSTQAEKFLEGYCLRISGSPEEPPLEELVSSGQALFQAQKNDPYVCLALGAVLTDSSMRDTPQFVDVLQSLHSLYQNGRQSPWLTARYYRLQASRAGSGGEIGRQPAPSTDEQRQHLKLAIESLLQAGADPALNDTQRQMLVYLLDDWADQYADNEFRDVLIAKLQEPQKTDAWASDVLLARHYIQAAWKARGSGMANTVTAEGWRQFATEMGKARFHAVRAWEKHSELPEAATEMITITMAGHGVEGVGTRFWFDEAVQSDLIGFGAYTNYVWSLRPRWGGSHAQMLALAREALDTGRFDTEVPYVFHQIAYDVAGERRDWEEVIREPGVYQGYVQLFQGYERAAKNDFWRNRQRTRLAAVAWRAGKKAETRRILTALGDSADPSAFEMFGLSLPEVARRAQEKSSARPPYFPEQAASATAIAMLADSKRLIQGNDQGEISVWDIESRQRQQLFKEHSTAVTCCLASMDGHQLVSSSSDGKINFWNVSDWKLLDTMNVPPPLHAIAVSADGSRFAVSHGIGADMELVVFDASTKKPLATLAIAGPPIFPLAFHPQGRRVFFSPQPAPGKEKLLVWNLEDRTTQARNGQLQGEITAWQAAPDGQKLAAGVTRLDRVLGKIKTVFLLALIDANSGAVLTELEHVPGRVRSIAYLQDGERIAATTENGALLVWRPGGDNISSCIRTGLDGLTTLALAPGASQAAAVDSDGQVHLLPLNAETAGWKIETPLLETRLHDFVRGLSSTPDGKYLVVDAPLSELSVWGWGSGLRTCKIAFHFPTVTYGVALFPDQQRVLCKVGAGNVVVNRIVSTTSGATLDSPPRSSCIAVSPTGNYFALGGDGISLFAADDYHPYPWGKLAGDKDIQHLVFSADGTVLLSANRFGSLKWYDLPAKPDLNTPTPQSRPTFFINRPPPFSLTISLDKALVANGRENVDVLDAANGQLLCSVPGKQVAFSPDSQRIIVAAAPNAANVAAIHEARTGRLLATLRGGHRAEISAVTFSPDGRAALTADQEGFIRAWDAAAGQELHELPSPAGGR